MTPDVGSTTAPLAFEVLRFEAAPSGADVALVELEGRFTGQPPRRPGRPRLVVELDGRPVEAGVVVGDDVPTERWRATFALPVAALDSPSFALAVGRDLLLDLPSPDATPGDPDAARLVRLARESNQLRRRLDEAYAEQARAEARAERVDAALVETRAHASALERVRAELEAEREREREALAAARRAAQDADRHAREAADGVRRELEGEREGERVALAAAQREIAGEPERREAWLADLREELKAEQERALQNAAETRRELDRERRRVAAELARVGEQSENERANADQRVEVARTEARELREAERRLQEELAAERARAAIVRRDLKLARAELEQLRRRGAGVPSPAALRATRDETPESEPRPSGPPEPGDETIRITATPPASAASTARAAGGGQRAGDDEPTLEPGPADGADDATAACDAPTGDEPTTATGATGATEEPTRERPLAPGPATTARRAAASPQTAAASAPRPSDRAPGDDERPGAAGEGVRVLTPGARRPRHRLEDEPEPEHIPAAALEAGARHIEPVRGSRAPGPRVLAFVALGLAVLAAVIAVLLASH